MTVEDERLNRLTVSARRAELTAQAKRGRPETGDLDDRTITGLAHAAAARVAALRTKAATPPLVP